jgi:hypothetical protein
LRTETVREQKTREPDAANKRGCKAGRNNKTTQEPGNIRDKKTRMTWGVWCQWVTGIEPDRGFLTIGGGLDWNV